MMASTPEAAKFLIWSSCLATSFCASSTCNSTPLMPLACSIMPLRSTVRKLSSNLAIDTPTLAAKADELISAAKATPKISFFIVFLLHIGVRLHRSTRNPRSPEESLPDAVSVPDGVFQRIGTPGSLFETDVPERKDQNA